MINLPIHGMKKVYCMNSKNGGGWALVKVQEQGVPDSGNTNSKAGDTDRMTPYSTKQAKFSDAVINELATHSNTYYYDCGQKVHAFFQLGHRFDFSKRGLMQPNDKCKREWGANWNKYGSVSGNSYGSSDPHQH